jgi:hypothetical protein
MAHASACEQVQAYKSLKTIGQNREAEAGIARYSAACAKEKAIQREQEAKYAKDALRLRLQSKRPGPCGVGGLSTGRDSRAVTKGEAPAPGQGGNCPELGPPVPRLSAHTTVERGC